MSSNQFGQCADSFIPSKDMDRHHAVVQGIVASVRGFYERKEPYWQHEQHPTKRQHACRRHLGSGASSRDRQSKKNSLRGAECSYGHLGRGNFTPWTGSACHYLGMEFPGITAGGGFAGTGGESSSFRHGFFDETVGRVEMVLANGEIVTAGRDERTDLFRTAPGAVGTFGIVTLLEINLILANKYVRTRYHRTRSVTDAVKLVREETPKPENDYVDGPTFIAKNRAIEDKVRSLGGTKWLYAHVYQPEDDLWTVYGGHGLYDELRAKYHASALPSVYDKVHVRWDDVHAGTVSRGWTVDHFAWLKAYWPIGCIWSAAISFVSGDCALHRNASWKWKEKE